MATRRSALPEKLSHLMLQLETRPQAETALLLRELRSINDLLDRVHQENPKLLVESSVVGAKMVIGSGPTACQCCKRPF